MQCPRCGPSPKVTIWDGVTLAFAKKNLLPTIWPPTRTHETSEPKPGIKPLHGLQIFTEKAMRKLIQNVLTGPVLRVPDSSGQTQTPPTRDDKEMFDRLDMIPDTISKLSELSPPMALLFDKWFGITQLSAGLIPPKEYRDLYLQVSWVAELLCPFLIYTNADGGGRECASVHE
jgi:hypothetical protein